MIKIIEWLIGAKYLDSKPKCIICNTKIDIVFCGWWHEGIKQIPIWICKNHDDISKQFMSGYRRAISIRS